MNQDQHFFSKPGPNTNIYTYITPNYFEDIVDIFY